MKLITYLTFETFFLFILAIVSCSLTLASEVTPKEIKIALSSYPTNLNPFFSTDANSQNINRLVHASLTDFNNEMQFVCVLCESFESKIRNNKHIIHFKLRKNLKFHDQSSLTSQDVYNSWKYFSDNKKIKSVFRFAFQKIENVIIFSPLEFELIFNKFNVENLSNLALLKILKINNLDNVSVNSIVGAGPYTLGDIDDLNIKIIPIDKSKPKLVFKTVKDETTLALKLLNGEVDLSLADMSPRKVEWLSKNSKQISLHSRHSTNYKYISINHKKAKFNNKKIINALSHLVPRDDIIKYKLKGQAIPATSLYSRAFKDLYLNKSIDQYDPELSSNLFKESGFLKNANGFWERNNEVFTLDWKSSNSKSSIELANLLKSYFEKNGVKVKLTFLEWGSFMKSFKTGQFDVLIGQWIGFTGADMMEFAFHSEKVPPRGGNRGYFLNAEFDKLISLAREEVNNKVRNKYYKEALSVAFSNYAYINLWHPSIIWLSRKCIKGVDLYPNGNFYGLLRLENHCE